MSVPEPTTEPKYRHACDEWDGFVIDEFDMEFFCCKCFQPTPDILAIQDALRIELDRARGNTGE